MPMLTGKWVGKPAHNSEATFLRLGKYYLAFYDKENCWLGNVKDGGMNLPYKKLTEFLDKYFEDNF